MAAVRHCRAAAFLRPVGAQAQRDRSAGLASPGVRQDAVDALEPPPWTAGRARAWGGLLTSSRFQPSGRPKSGSTSGLWLDAMCRAPGPASAIRAVSWASEISPLPACTRVWTRLASVASRTRAAFTPRQTDEGQDQADGDHHDHAQCAHDLNNKALAAQGGTNALRDDAQARLPGNLPCARPGNPHAGWAWRPNKASLRRPFAGAECPLHSRVPVQQLKGGDPVSHCHPSHPVTATWASASGVRV